MAKYIIHEVLDGPKPTQAVLDKNHGSMKAVARAIPVGTTVRVRQFETVCDLQILMGFREIENLGATYTYTRAMHEY